MFTGIIEEIGTVQAIESHGDSTVVRIAAPLVVSDTQHGASIAVDGVCLTVIEFDSTGFSADAMGETLARSTLGALAPGDKVNLERPVRLSDRLGGHVVQGHVDSVGTILTRTDEGRWEVVRVAIPASLASYVVEKGSITIDGISLTVSAVSHPDATECWLEVSLIPTTREMTTLGAKPVGAQVNLEVELLAKYVERALDVAGLRVAEGSGNS